jgi:hypothetical protein
MIDKNWVYLAVAINLVSALIYAYSVIRGRTRPNRVTWFILSFAPLLAFGGMLAQGVTFRESVFTLQTAIGPVIVVISTFFAKQPKWRITQFDLFCGALSIIGFILAYTMRQGDIAILFGVIADGLAFLPTLVKAFKYPETENPAPFIVGIAAAVIAIAIVTTYDFKHLAFPVYILIADLIATLFIYFKIGKPIMRALRPAES